MHYCVILFLLFNLFLLDCRAGDNVQTPPPLDDLEINGEKVKKLDEQEEYEKTRSAVRRIFLPGRYTLIEHDTGDQKTFDVLPGGDIEPVRSKEPTPTPTFTPRIYTPRLNPYAIPAFENANPAPSYFTPRISPSDVHVNGYFRKDGTYVRGHMRSHSDGLKFNNFSARGNTNPYTHKRGYKD